MHVNAERGAPAFEIELGWAMSGNGKEIAEAIQAVAKVGERSIDLVEKAGSFMAEVLRGPAEEVAGIVQDRLRFVRWIRLVEIGDQVHVILRDRGITDTRPVPPKLALPIFEDASLEEDSDLQKLWANLLANAMDPAFNGEIRYGFLEMLKSITAREANLLKELHETVAAGENFSLPQCGHFIFEKQEIMKVLQFTEDEYLVSVNNLMRMRCVDGALLTTTAIQFGGIPNTVYRGTDAIVLTPLGFRFVEACIHSVRMTPS